MPALYIQYAFGLDLLIKVNPVYCHIHTLIVSQGDVMYFLAFTKASWVFYCLLNLKCQCFSPPTGVKILTELLFDKHQGQVVI